MSEISDFDDLQNDINNSNKIKELKIENSKLKKEVKDLNIRIKEYEEVISKDNIKELGYSNLTEDDLFNITHNSTYIIDTK